MRLEQAIAHLDVRERAQFDGDLEIARVTHDSREAGPDAVFVAVPGFKRDGLDFAPAAIAAGCRAIVADRIPADLAPGVSCIVVDDARAALAPLARALSGEPDRELRLIGVTGTNGKTSVVHLVAEVLRRAGRRVGVLGTLGFDMHGELVPTKNTTPESTVLYPLLRRGVEHGLDDVVMEVSSHALELHRVDGLEFEAAMFTNLSADHLEVHGGMEEYYLAKRRLFERTVGACIVQVDDEWGARLARECAEVGRRVVRCSMAGADAEVRAEEIAADLEGTSFDLVVAGERAESIGTDPQGASSDLDAGETRRRVRLQAIGAFNVANAVVTAAAMLELGVPLDVVVAGLEATPPVTGRMERVPNDRGLDVIVDSAHTPDALIACLDSLRELSGRPVTLVHGVLSDRPRELLRDLERVAVRHADHVIFTEADMKVGTMAEVLDAVTDVLDEGPASWEFVENRWAAIGAGVERARSRGDVVVIAGKGDERQMYLPHDAGAVPIHEPEAAAYAIAGGDPVDLDPRR